MQVKCTYCGDPLERAECLVRRNVTGDWFCNSSCHAGHLKTVATIKCERCSKPFVVRKYRAGSARFCSVKCRRLRKIYRCETCDRKVERSPSHAVGRVFCSRECAAEHSQFQPGFTPWNKGVSGLRLSPKSEFKPGPRPDKRHPIGAISIRTRKRVGKQRAWVKVADPNKWKLRSQLVWIANNGPIPKGSIVHHKNRDTLNDAIGNLELLTRAQHLREHRSEFRKRRWKKKPASP